MEQFGKAGDRGLTAKQLRFWEVVLRLPRGQVDAWLKEPGRAIWDQRTRRTRS